MLYGSVCIISWGYIKADFFFLILPGTLLKLLGECELLSVVSSTMPAVVWNKLACEYDVVLPKFGNLQCEYKLRGRGIPAAGVRLFLHGLSKLT
jgi:hypothetical protein